MVYVVEIVVGESVNPAFDELVKGKVELEIICELAVGVVDANIGLSICVGADAVVELVDSIAAVDVVDGGGSGGEVEVELDKDGASVVEEVDAVLKPPGSTLANVLLYVVINTTTLSPPENCRFAKREGSSAIPPHFWAASPGQGTLHAESGYVTKSSDGVPLKEEQKHSLGFY